MSQRIGRAANADRKEMRRHHKAGAGLGSALSAERRAVSMHRRLPLGFCAAVIFLYLLLVPTVAFAQSGIAGVVADATGAVLPGVTVEASSPALIEKVRSAVSDAQGR